MLVLSTAHLLKIEKYARAAYPEECCGVLAGSFDGYVRRVTAIYRTTNAAPRGTRDSYEIEPRALHRVMRQIREARLQLLGFYHSHPDSAPTPSAADAQKAWPSYSYVIVSVMGGDPVAVRSWRWSIEARGFEQEPVQVAALGPGIARFALAQLNAGSRAGV